MCLQMIAPGYYQAECSEKKPCKEGMYCNVLYCEKCHKLNVACSGKDQCCKGLICGFGRCEKKSKGDPGKKSKYLYKSPSLSRGSNGFQFVISVECQSIKQSIDRSIDQSIKSFRQVYF